jgi:hypothetical protein
MKSLFAKYHYHIFIVIIGLLWIFLFDFLIQMSNQGIVYADSWNYIESAKNLFVFHRGHSLRPIVMAFISGIPYLFGGDDQTLLTYSFYINLFCWLGFFVVLFEIVKEFLTPKKAFLSTIPAIFIVGNTAHVFHLLTETIILFSTIVGFYFLIQYYKKQQFRYLSLALTIFILNMLIKPGFKFLAIFFVLFFSREIIRNLKSKFSWFLYGSLFLVLLQCAGLKYQFGNFTISYIDGITYYNYLGSKAMCLKFDKEYSQIDNPRAEFLFSYESYEQKRIAGEDLKKQLQYNTVNLAKAYVLDIIENTKTGNTCIEDCKNVRKSSSFPFWKSVLFDISKWQNRFFTLMAILLAGYCFFRSDKNDKVIFLLSVYMLYVIATSGISCSQGDRFHLVTFPFIIVLLAKLYRDRTTINKKV